MTALDLFWHLAGFAAVPLLFGVLSAGAVRCLWRRRWGSRPFWPAVGWSAFVALAVALAGLVLTGRDGALHTYGAMVLACSALLAWRLRGG